MKSVVHIICGHRKLSLNNPFAKDRRRPKQPFTSNKEMRDAVLKRKFDKNNVSKKSISRQTVQYR